ncbi:hypothetical protein [Shewanella acanthi]|uniref:hypothetical protein n=1 Tax=Shewanella acanthi TaxID=2864212 RepID=UPI003D9CBA3D
MKALRLALHAWGRYWAHQEMGKGHANRSACDKFGEPIAYGSGVVHELTVPKHVAVIDKLVEKLTPNCRRAIRAHYVCKGNWALLGFDSKKSYIYWLRRAEIALA